MIYKNEENCELCNKPREKVVLLTSIKYEECVFCRIENTPLEVVENFVTGWSFVVTSFTPKGTDV